MKDPSELASTRLREAGCVKDLTRRLAWGFLIAATLMEILVAVALMDYWLVLAPGLRLGGFVLLVALLGIGVGGWLKLRRRPATMKQAALDVEAARPDLGCVVSTAAEYLSGERRVEHEYEPELVAALEAQAARDLEKARVPYERRVIRPAGFFAFALVSLLVFAAAVPVAWTAFKRTVTPWSKETYTHLEVRPGSMEIPVGHDLEITNIFTGRTPRDPTLHWRPLEQRAWKDVPLTRTPEGLYLHPFAKLQESIQYRVTGNDAASEIYEITTYVPPEVRELQIRVAYPDYTRVKPFEQTAPDLKVLRASELAFRVTASTALATARLRFSNGPPVVLTPGPENLWTGSFKAATNDHYWIELADAKGHRGGNEQPYQLRVLPDHPPKVAILEPGQDLRADATDIIPLKLAASDDFGVAEVKVVYHKLGGPAKTLPCTLTNGEAAEVLGAAQLKLADLNLGEYELVAYHAEALDNNTLDGPGRAASPVYFIEITHEESGQGKAAKGNGKKVNLLVIQKQIVADTTALGPRSQAGNYSELSARQKEAADFANIYHDSLSEMGAPEEAVALMEQATKEMKEASRSLAEKNRESALPAEEKALADLYQVLKLMPQLGSMPTQPPPEQDQAARNEMVRVALEAIKQKQKDQPQNEELAEALRSIQEMSRAQAGLNQATEQPSAADPKENADAQSPGNAGKPSDNQEGQQNMTGGKAGQAERDAQAKAGAKKGQKPGDQANSGDKAGEKDQDGQANGGKKDGQEPGDQDQAGDQAGKGDQDAQAKAGGRKGSRPANSPARRETNRGREKRARRDRKRRTERGKGRGRGIRRWRSWPSRKGS